MDIKTPMQESLDRYLAGLSYDDLAKFADVSESLPEEFQIKLGVHLRRRYDQINFDLENHQKQIDYLVSLKKRIGDMSMLHHVEP